MPDPFAFVPCDLTASAMQSLQWIVVMVIFPLASACGDGKGPHCGSWFSSMSCGTGEACCHDDFNSWCCPSGWKCQGVYNDPGGNTHCMTPSHISSSCQCTQTDFEVTGIKASGDPRLISSASTDFTEKCAAHASRCGISQSQEWRQEKSMDWRESFSAEVHLGFPIKVGSIGATFSGTYHKAESQTEDVSIHVGITCQAGDSGFSRDTTVKVSSTTQMWEQPVTMTYKHCGESKSTQATVRATRLLGDWKCTFDPPPEPTWTKYPNKNCYDSHGAASIWEDRAIPGKTLEGCKGTCGSWYDWYGKQCTAVTMDMAGNCWLRVSVAPSECVQDSNYDTFVVSKEGVWTKYGAANCYHGYGGVAMPDVPFTSTDASGCQGICKKTASCDAIAVDKTGECWLRSNVEIADCDDDTSYDTFTLM